MMDTICKVHGGTVLIVERCSIPLHYAHVKIVIRFLGIAGTAEFRHDILILQV